MRLLKVEHSTGEWPPVRHCESLTTPVRNRCEFLKLTSVDVLRAQIIFTGLEPSPTSDVAISTNHH
ncbi:MAG: hypothetical protein ABI980_05300 [Nitrospirota bacterium]